MPSKKVLMERRIDCPRCFAGMSQETVDAGMSRVTVDVCPKCGGVWLDEGELKKLTGNRKLSDYLTKDIGTKTESKLVCPRCGGLMDLEHADDVEADVCLDCHGVWLDRGELDGLKSKKGFKGDSVAKAEERYEDMAARDRGRGSLLSRIFGRRR